MTVLLVVNMASWHFPPYIAHTLHVPMVGKCVTQIVPAEFFTSIFLGTEKSVKMNSISIIMRQNQLLSLMNKTLL